MGILPVENLKDFFCVGVVFRKDNSFAQLFTVINPQTVGHENMQDFLDSVLVKYPLVQS